VIVKLRDGSIVLKSETGTDERTVPLVGINPISITVDRTGTWIAVSALLEGGNPPSIKLETADRGDLRLLVCETSAAKWHALGRGFALDPAWFPDSRRVAFSTKTGPAIADVPTGKVDSVRVGRFGWGPPSISVNPSGSRVAFVKWRSDSRILGSWDIGADEAQTFGISCHNYTWWDDDTILFQLNGPPRLLDLVSGRPTTFARLEQLLEAMRPAAEPELAHIPQSAPHWDPTTGIVWGARLSAHQDRVYADFAVGGGGTEGGAGLFSLNRDLRDPILHGWFAGWRLARYHIAETPGLFNAILERGTGRQFERKRLWFGPGAEAIGADWLPLSPIRFPEFGSHFFG